MPSVLSIFSDSKCRIIKNMCQMLATKVLAKFPKANPSVIVGGFFFLRFLSPAMVSAETLGIAEGMLCHDI